MNWLGVPFLFDKSVENLSLSLNNIPKLVIETPFSWETVISALIAGLLPSAIAYIALNNNFKLANHQTKLIEKKEFSQAFRVAAADYTTEMIMYTSAFQQWKIAGVHDFEALQRGVLPKELIAPMKAVEKSKNNLMLLIPPDTGALLITSLAKTQQKMQNYLKADIAAEPEKKEFNDSANDFMYDCHELLKSLG